MVILPLALLAWSLQTTETQPSAPAQSRLGDVGSVVEGLSDTVAATPPAAPQTSEPRTGNADERRALAQAVARGRLLFAHARAGAIATQDMLARVADPGALNITGWLAEPEGNGMAVAFYVDGPDGPRAVYRGLVLGGRVSSRDLHLQGDRPALSPLLTRMAAARRTVEGADRRVCGGANAGFNVIVLPPSSERDPVLVYQLSPIDRAGPQAGGHYRTEVAAEGNAGETVSLGGSCETLAVPVAAAGQRPQPIALRRSATPLPNEVHVLTALIAGRPLVVNAGARVWGVAGEGIAPLVAAAPASRRPAQGR